MRVSQLIEALQHLPPDLEVVTHASNHSSRRTDRMIVGLAKEQSYNREVAVIGNYTWLGRELTPIGTVFQVDPCGDNAGKLIECAVEHKPERRVPHTTHTTVPERWETVER